MVEWHLRSLGDLVTLQRGIDLPASKRNEGTVPVMGSFGITGYHDKAAATGPGVTVGRSGASIGAVSYTDRDYWPLNTCLFVTDFKGNDPRFVYYILSTLDLASYNSGSAQPSLNRNYIYNIPLAFPNAKEQKKISQLLGALDDKIELNRQMNSTLKGMARAIFKSWFVDFDPVRAKMEGRKPYLPQEIWSLFPDHLGEDGSPSGWSEKPLTHFFEIVSGGTPKTSEVSYWGGDVPWFSVMDTPSGADTYVIDTEKTITAKGLQNSSAQLIEAGATIVSARGTVGNLAKTGRPMAFNQSCYGLRGANGYGPSFVFLTASHMVSKLQSLAHGSVFSTITRQTFEAISLFAPSSELASRFEMVSGPLFDGILANVQESRTLSTIRDLLLPKLVLGEVRIKDAEKLIGEVGV